LRTASRANPAFAEAWYNLADLLDDQGRLEAAVECFRKALVVAQVWSGLNQCTGGYIKGGTGCTNNEFWRIAHAEVVNLDTAVCDKYGN
jgi:tetratricopeptide (TPR) repeat protein